MPRMSRWYLSMCLITWAYLDASYRVWTFHAPRRSLPFGPSTLPVTLITSRWGLSSKAVILPGIWLESTLRVLVELLFFLFTKVSVTFSFSQDEVVSLIPNLQPGEPVGCHSSSFYPLTYSAWLNMPGMTSLVKVSEKHKLPQQRQGNNSPGRRQQEDNHC